MHRPPATLIILMLAATAAFAQGRASDPIDYQTAHLSRASRPSASPARSRSTATSTSRNGRWRLRRTDFIQRQPFRVCRRTSATEVRILYDDDNLYVGYNCFDSDPATWSSMGWSRTFSSRSLDTRI
jgi:hypothetical protein